MSLYVCTNTERDLESGCTVCNGSRKRPDQLLDAHMVAEQWVRDGQRPERQQASCEWKSISELTNILTALVCRTELPPASTQSRIWAIETRADINDIMAHKLLCMRVQEQAEIDKLTVETLDGAKNEWIGPPRNMLPKPLSPFR